MGIQDFIQKREQAQAKKTAQGLAALKKRRIAEEGRAKIYKADAAERIAYQKAKQQEKQARAERWRTSKTYRLGQFSSNVAAQLKRPKRAKRTRYVYIKSSPSVRYIKPKRRYYRARKRYTAKRTYYRPKRVRRAKRQKNYWGF